LSRGGSKLTYKTKPRRRRGFYEFEVEKGKVFVDFFADKDPIGLKLLFGKYGATMQNATYRFEISKEGQFLSSVDRGNVNFYLPSTGAVFPTKAGFGVHNNNDKVEVGQFSWADDYPWEERIKNITKKGYGVAATFKATPLSKRPEKVNPNDLKVSWRQKETRQVRKKPSKMVNNVSSMIKEVSMKATEGLKSVVIAPTKISESRDAIKDFEKIQKQKAKALDNIE